MPSHNISLQQETFGYNSANQETRNCNQNDN